MLGYTEKELSQLEKWDRIVHPDERDAGAQRYAEMVQGKRDEAEWEQRFIRRDGRIVVANARFLRRGLEFSDVNSNRLFFVPLAKQPFLPIEA